MRTFIASLLTAGSILPISVMVYEGQLNLVPRYHAGTIQADVQRVQTYTESDALGAMIRKLDALRYNRNMSAVRAHVTCVEAPEKCGNQGWNPHQ